MKFWEEKGPGMREQQLRLSSYDGFSLASHVGDLALLSALCGCYWFEALKKLPRAPQSFPIPSTPENYRVLPLEMGISGSECRSHVSKQRLSHYLLWSLLVPLATLHSQGLGPSLSLRGMRTWPQRKTADCRVGTGWSAQTLSQGQHILTFLEKPEICETSHFNVGK